MPTSATAGIHTRRPLHLLAVAATLAATTADSPGGLPSQSLPAPFRGQHVGVSLADLNGDGANDLLIAAGRHWVDQSYALINLGPKLNEDGVFEGVRFSEALPVGPSGACYQIDVSPSSPTLPDGDETRHRSTVLLVGGTCHVETPNEFGSCVKGENTPARVLHVSMSEDGCSVRNPNAPCDLQYEVAWAHPDPQGDRNGGFADFDGTEVIALLGQGGIELWESMHEARKDGEGQDFLRTGYSSVYQHSPPKATDPRSDYSRYAGFAAGQSPKLGGVVAAGRRTDYDEPSKDEDGNILGINRLFYREGGDGTFGAVALPAARSGEPYPGDPRYSLQSTNYAFADIDGDGVEDLLEATFLYKGQRMPGYPLPQRIHFLDEEGGVRDTLVVLEEGAAEGTGAEDDDAGRSVTTGQIFADTALPDVVFASAEGVVTIFANLGTDETTGKFQGLEKRYALRVGTEGCQVRDVAVAPLAREASGRCWTGIVCAVTCGVEVPGSNHVVYVEGCGGSGGCNGGGGVLEGELGSKTSVS